YNQDSTSSPLTIEAPPQPSPFINLIPPPTVAAYSPETGGPFYPPAASHVFPSLDVRPRLGSNTTSTSMTHAHRSSLPQQSTRDIYSPATPTYRRPEPRSPPYPRHIQRHPLSPTPSPSLNFTHPLRMDPNYSNKGAGQSVPPFSPITTAGTLAYVDQPSSPITVDINGVIDKGFFLADNDWTCYRRNYFSCICSYSLNPPPNFTAPAIQFLPKGGGQPYSVYGFAMSISAVVADNDNHTIDLVQHTPKRDKGPIAKPEKVRLMPKPPSHHPLGYSNQDPAARAYDQGYGQSQGSHPTEHAFERIQFKQATANNGKRRAAQQYYHLVVELWADVQNQHNEQFVKVAYKKSAKMIVRGRSPGHYQSERRGSTSSGPGGSGGGSIGGGYPSSVMGHEYGSGGSLLPTSYSNSAYDPRSTSGYGGTRHHDLTTLEPMISADDTKSITETKGYQYYPAPLYEGSDQDSKHQVELFTHARSEPESLPHMHTGIDLGGSRIKSESELPGLYYPGQSFWSNRCGRFEGKTASSGYYPTLNIPT
ncbi:p53-like transcription factor, partial [Thozetella sp. PMI_491]